MSSKKDFLKAFFKERKMTGSVVPSSRFLSKKMLESINFKDAACVVELGPGTGVFTRELLRRMPETSKLIVVELNETFLENLKSSISDKRAIFIHDSAEKIEQFLQHNGVEQADYIVSSLPLSTIPANIRKAILTSAYNSLRPKGEFIQFQYSLHQRKNLKRIYSNVSIGYTPLNFPPAFVYRCVK